MSNFFYCSLLFCCTLFATCAPGKYLSARKNDPLVHVLKTLKTDSLSAAVLNRPQQYDLQIIYTQIDRNADGKPSFSTFYYNADSSRYFYPASTVKMPLALLALEKINHLRRSGYPALNRNTPYKLDSLRVFQQALSSEPQAPGGKPSIAHDIRQVFAISDNEAYNHLFEFLGREHINRRLQELGYTRTGIVHRFNYPGRDNRYASPIAFYDRNGSIFREKEKYDEGIWANPQHATTKGKGWYNVADSLVMQPFDMRNKNWFALTDMEKMLRSIIFPESLPEQQRFLLTADDYRFLWHYMGIFPRECDWPRYDTSHYYDGYVKFFLFGDSHERRDGNLRVFNKVGEAYGTLTDVAYVVDFEKGVEFILAATILCNSDGIFNDDTYDYDAVGFPFLARLGRAVYASELTRQRVVPPDLTKIKQALEQR
jgi:Beta-lactamase enzyme family